MKIQVIDGDAALTMISESLGDLDDEDVTKILQIAIQKPVKLIAYDTYEIDWEKELIK